MPSRLLDAWLPNAERMANKVTSFSSCVFLATMLLLSISDPFLRYLVGTPIYWSNEVSTFMMLESAFAALGITLLKGKHVRVTLIHERLSVKAQNILLVILSLFTIFYAGIIAYSVLRLAISSLRIRALTPSAEIPFFPFQMLAAAGLTFFFFAGVVFTIKRIAIVLGLKEEEKRRELVDTTGFVIEEK